jgi:hypothetical protein
MSAFDPRRTLERPASGPSQCKYKLDDRGAIVVAKPLRGAADLAQCGESVDHVIIFGERQGAKSEY